MTGEEFTTWPDGSLYGPANIVWRKCKNPFMVKSSKGHHVTFNSRRARDLFLEAWRLKLKFIDKERGL